MKSTCPTYNNRSYCALGAQQCVTAIPGAIPILYASRTCTIRLHQGLSEMNGHQGIGMLGGDSVICTGMHNIPLPDPKTTDTLENAIETALYTTRASLYVVLTGCVSALIGDNEEAIVNRYKKNGVPILLVETAGFKANVYRGYEWVCKAIADYYSDTTCRHQYSTLINIWSTVPYADPFWSGNLDAIRGLLGQIGIDARCMFGRHSSVDSWKSIGQASANLLLSPWAGYDLMAHLKDKFGTPILPFALLPIGATATGKFLRFIAEELHLDKKKVEAVIERNEADYYYYVQRASGLFTEYRASFPVCSFVVADSAYALSLSHFLSAETGITPVSVYLTDNPPARFRASIEAQLVELNVEGYFVDNDSFDIRTSIREKAGGRIPLILGGSWEADIARQLHGCYVGISNPQPDKLILNRSYLGYQGGLLLLEELYNCILEQCG